MATSRRQNVYEVGGDWVIPIVWYAHPLRDLLGHASTMTSATRDRHLSNAVHPRSRDQATSCSLRFRKRGEPSNSGDDQIRKESVVHKVDGYGFGLEGPRTEVTIQRFRGRRRIATRCPRRHMSC
jgi:hypothetical protein